MDNENEWYKHPLIRINGNVNATIKVRKTIHVHLRKCESNYNLLPPHDSFGPWVEGRGPDMMFSDLWYLLVTSHNQCVPPQLANLFLARTQRKVKKVQLLVTREYIYFLPSRKYISLSWCDNNSQEKLETMVKQNVGGKTMSIMVFFK